MDDIAGGSGPSGGSPAAPPILPGYPGPAGQATPATKGNGGFNPLEAMFPITSPMMRSVMFPLISRLFK